MGRMYKKPEGRTELKEGTQTKINLARNYHTSFYLGKLTLTHDNGASPVFKDPKALSILNSIELLANGDLTIKSIPSKKLYINNVLGTTKAGKAILDTTANKNGAVSTVWFVLPMSMFGTVRPHDTILNTGLFRSLELLFNWGAKTQVGADITVTDARVDVWSSSLVGYKRNSNETIKYFLERSTTEEVTSTTTDFSIKLPVNKLYKEIIIASDIAGVATDAIVKGVRLESGTTTICQMDADALRQDNIFDYKPSTLNDLTGILAINFNQRGRFTDFLNTLNGSQLNTLDLILDVEHQAGGKNNLHILMDSLADTQKLEVTQGA